MTTDVIHIFTIVHWREQEACGMHCIALWDAHYKRNQKKKKNMYKKTWIWYLSSTRNCWLYICSVYRIKNHTNKCTQHTQWIIHKTTQRSCNVSFSRNHIWNPNSRKWRKDSIRCACTVVKHSVAIGGCVWRLWQYKQTNKMVFVTSLFANSFLHHLDNGRDWKKLIFMWTIQIWF